MTFKFTPNEKQPQDKLADCELHFEGELEGFKLAGFAVWNGREGGRNVTFPSRNYTVNGERRSYALFRPVGDVRVIEHFKDLLLAAYDDFVAREVQRQERRK